MNNSLFSYDRVYQAFSGADMVAHINEIPVGTMQAVTVSITREVAPLYVMGDPNAKTFVKGKRGIAGSLSFSTFDRHALLNDIFLQQAGGKGMLTDNWFTDQRTMEAIAQYGQWYTSDGNGQLLPSNRGAMDYKYPENMVNTGPISRVIDAWKQRKLRYSDELPPFNITLTMVNDYGAASTCSINGVVLINEGYGFTMDDLTNEQSFTYVAREVTPLTSLSSGLFTQHKTN